VCNSTAAIEIGRIISDAISPSVVEAYDGVFGHLIGPPAENVIQVAFTNINSLPDDRCSGGSCRSCKDCKIIHLINQHCIDHLEMSEIAVNWKYSRDESLKPYQRTKHWFSARKVTASYFKISRLYRSAPSWWNHVANNKQIYHTLRQLPIGHRPPRTMVLAYPNWSSTVVDDRHRLPSKLKRTGPRICMVTASRLLS
jgi:hypothetical protein